jgi:hypothetical protein
MATHLEEMKSINDVCGCEDVDLLICNGDLVEVQVRENYLWEQEDD